MFTLQFAPERQLLVTTDLILYRIKLSTFFSVIVRSENSLSKRIKILKDSPFICVKHQYTAIFPVSNKQTLVPLVQG